LKSGKLFSIVTSRGHEPSTLKSGVRWIIDNVLSNEDINEMKNNLRHFNNEFSEVVSDDKLVEYYLEKCYFIGLFSEEFKTQFGFDPRGNLANKGKQVAIKYFTNYIRNYAKKLNLPMKVGFSDDDIGFSTAAKKLFMSMNRATTEDFYVFNTSNPDLKNGIKTKIIME
jgi:hypothetical protein